MDERAGRAVPVAGWGWTMAPSAHHVSTAAIAELLGASRQAARRRSHLLLHADHADQVQRLLIAAQPGTFVRPHCHSEQWEMITLLRGAIDFLILDADGGVRERHALTESAPLVQIPAGTWHTAFIRAPDTVVLEIKPGPYRPNEFAAWAPQEGTAEAGAMLAIMDAAGPGRGLS